MATFLRAETLLRMALDAEAAGRSRYAARCWATLTRDVSLADVPGDELQRIYAAACRANQAELARRVRVETNLRMANADREPLVSRFAT